MSTDEESSLLQESGDDDRDLENGSPRFRIGTGFLAVMLVSNFLASSDDSFVLSSASEIAADLKTTKASTWLITGFNLGYMVSLPVNGYLCAALGRKQTYLFSNAVGTSLNIYVSILARIVTGFGSSGILDLSSVLINDLGGPFEAAVLRSYFMTVMMIGYSGGGTLGGLLATLVGWRWSFLLHVPIILICALVTLIQLPRDIPRVLQAPLGDNGEEQETKASKPMSMDIVGIILLVGAIVSTLMMIQVLQEDIVPDNKLYIGTALGTISLLLVGIFFINEVWWAKKPLFPLSFMLSSQTGIVCAVQVLAMISDLAVSFTSPRTFSNAEFMKLSSTISDYFVRTKDFSMVAASACLAPSALGGALGGYLAGNHIQRLVHQVLTPFHED
ncbi:major facilitator superfamily domain-containing protein [Penicillium lividum]|nr:major facilitator superfamily domain-containing protein [Penicillium lividum]